MLYLILVLTTGWLHAAPLTGDFDVLTMTGDAPTAEDQPDWPVKKGGDVALAMGEYDLIWPGEAKAGLRVRTAPYLDTFVYQTLMMPKAFGETNAVFAGLVSSISAGSEMGEFTLHMNPAATFSDGAPVRASDVVFSWTYCLSHMWNNGLDTYTNSIMGPKFEIRAENDRDVQLHFHFDSDAEIRKALFQFVTEIYIFKPNPNVDPNIEVPYPYLGTGPYRVERATREDIIYARRADYWDRDANYGNFDHIKILVVRDDTTRRRAFMAGLTNIWPEVNTVMEPYMDQKAVEKGLRRTTIPMSPVYDLRVIYLNLSRPVTGDVRVRQALNIALNDDMMSTAFRTLDNNRRTRLTALGTTGRYQISGRPPEDVRALMAGDENAAEAAEDFQKMGMFYGRGARTTDASLRAAQKRLHDAGYVLSGNSLEKEGRPVSLNVLYQQGSADTTYMDYFAENLRRLGFEVNVQRATDAALLSSALHANDYDLYVGTINGITRDFNYPDVDLLRLKFSTLGAVVDNPSGENFSNLRSPTLDRILAEMRATDNTTPRFHDLVEAFLRLISANIPFLFLGEPVAQTIYADPHIQFAPKLGNLLLRAYWDPNPAQ